VAIFALVADGEDVDTPLEVVSTSFVDNTGFEVVTVVVAVVTGDAQLTGFGTSLT
jgi:hypothetical protein